MVGKFIFTLFLLMSAPAVFGALKTGDLLLQPLSCWSCFLIEEQENTKFSHMGIYLNVDGEDLVLEAYGEVKITPLEKFLNRTEAGEEVQIRRFKSITFREEELLQIALPMVGLAYDNEFLWFNEDQKGEKLYCSELAYKLFYSFYGKSLPLKPMRFDKNRKHWAKFFNNKIPDGLLGNSPGDFERSNLFETVGHL